MKHVMKLAAMVTALSLMVCGFAGCASLLPTEEDIMPPPISKPEEVTYQTELVELGDIQDARACFGSVTSKKEENLSFALESGTLYKVYVERGDMVKKGDLLAEAENTTIGEQVEALEESMYRAKLQNDYTLNKLAQSLKTTKKGVNNQKSGLDALKSEASAMEAELKKLEEELAALAADLEAKKALTLEDLDATGVPYTQEQIDYLIADAETVYAAKLEEVNAYKAELAERKANVSVVEENYASAKENLALEQQYYDMQKKLINMDLSKNNENLEELKSKLAETQIFAPFDGKVTYVTGIEKGEPIDEKTRIVTVVDPDDLWFEYLVKDADIEADNFQKQFYVGREFVLSFGENVSVNAVVVEGTSEVPEDAFEDDKEAYAVHMEMESIPESVTMGTVGNTTVIVEEKENVVVVKSANLQFTGEEDARSYYCYILQDGLPTVRNVEVGIVTKAYIEVTNGLEVGEELVLDFRY